MEGPSKTELSSEASQIFREGIVLVLSRWSALQLAVENEWGGRDSRLKSEQLSSDIFSWFIESKELYIDELEHILDDGLVSLNTEADDGSIEEVAYKLMVMREECLEGNYKSIENLRETISQTQTRTHVRQDMEDDGSDSDDDDDEQIGANDSTDMIIDAGPQSQSNSNAVQISVNEPNKPTVAEDGWEVVAPRRRRGQRN